MSRFRRSPTPADTLRSLQCGDLWAYQVSGTLMRPEAGPPRTLRGAIVVTVVPDRLLGRTDGLMLSFAQELEVDCGDGSFEPFLAPTMLFSFAQDLSTNDASILGDNMGRDGMCRRAAAPQVFYPGRWFLGTRYDNRIEFGGGDFVHNTLLVTGHVSIETPAGASLSWVADITSESPVMGKISGIDWWTPELGAPACFDTSAALPNGSISRIVATLSRTNVQPGHALAGRRERA